MHLAVTSHELFTYSNLIPRYFGSITKISKLLGCFTFIGKVEPLFITVRMIYVMNDADHKSSC